MKCLQTVSFSIVVEQSVLLGADDILIAQSGQQSPSALTPMNVHGFFPLKVAL